MDLHIEADYSRHSGVLEHRLLAATNITCVGVGGAAGLVALLARGGVARWNLVDPDRVSATNPTTQGHDLADWHRPKVVALAERLLRINPLVHVRPMAWPYEQLQQAERDAVWGADLVLAMTDSFHTQALLNQEAIARGVDCIFAICYIGCGAVEVTATFRDAIERGRGCHRCHTKRRYDAYAAGFKNPPTIASHALAAEYLNALIAAIALGRLHARAGSELPIAAIGHAFAERPCLISRLVPTFGTAAGEAFAGLPPTPFTTSLWPIDTPAGFTCPDCGTPGGAHPCPLANPGSGATQERS